MPLSALSYQQDYEETGRWRKHWWQKIAARVKKMDRKPGLATQSTATVEIVGTGYDFMTNHAPRR